MAGKGGITPSKNSFNIPPAKTVNAFQLSLYPTTMFHLQFQEETKDLLSNNC